MIKKQPAHRVRSIIILALLLFFSLPALAAEEVPAAAGTWISLAPPLTAIVLALLLRICDEAGAELPPGEPGLIYFEREEMPLQYDLAP